MSARFIALFAFLSACCFSGFAKLPEYTLHLWTVEDRLPDSPVLDIAQDSSGYLWMVSRNRLIRFNGEEFLSIPIPEEARLACGEFRGVFCERNDQIWVFGEKGLIRFAKNAWSPALIGNAEESDVGKILGLYETEQGCLYAYAERGILIGQSKTKDAAPRFTALPCPVPSDDRATMGALTGAALDRHGRLWITAWNGLAEFSDGKFDEKRVHLPDFLVEAVTGVCAGNSGRLWVYGPNGVAYCENDIWTPIGFPPNAGMATVMTEVSDGSLWIGNSTGLFRWQNNVWQSVASQDVPGSLSINSLIEDSDGTLWAACEGGLLRIRPKVVQELKTESSASGNSAYSLWRQPDNTAWIGYKERAVHVKADGGLLQTIYLGIDVPISAILQDPEGRVWLGTLGAGLFMQQHNKLFTIPQNDYSLPQIHTIYSLTQDPKLGLLVGTHQGLLRVNAQRELEPCVLYGNQVNGPIRAMIREDDGRFTLCGDAFGILRIAPDGGKTQLGEAAGLRGSPRTMYREGDRFWLGTTSGLFCLLADQLVPIPLPTEISNNSILQISEDGNQRLWLGTTEGLQCVEIQDLLAGLKSAPQKKEQMPRFLQLGVSDGLPGKRCLGGIAPGQGKNDGNIWFPNEGGIAVVNPKEVAFSKRLPVVLFESIAVEEKPVAFEQNRLLLIPPGARDISFTFIALAPGIPETVRYRYRLEGGHREWSPIQRERTVKFEWLPPGDYTLRIRAESGGIWNHAGENDAVCTFVVGAYFWQTLPFYLTVSLLFAGLVAWIARKLLSHRYQLQMAVLKREEALSEERARISRDIHDDLGNGLSVIATLSELAQNDVESESAHKRLDQIYEVANGLARNVDEIVWAVNPANDGWDAFVSYFEQYTEYFLGSSGLRFRIIRPDSLTGKNIAAKARHHLLLATREAVGNVLKHAEATQVKITMTVEENGTILSVRVQDDGKGFSLEKKAGVGHDGLENMGRRMRLAGGTISIQSKPGEGTCVEFRVPLENDTNA